MKNAKIMKTITALVLSAALVASVAACSSKTEETTKAEETTTEATTEETTTEATTEETTTEATTEETTEESSDESADASSAESEITADSFTNEAVKAEAQKCIDGGSKIAMVIDPEIAEAMELENVEEGFYAGSEDGKSITLVVKFADVEAAKKYVDTENEGLEESEQAKLVENDDGSFTLEVPDNEEGSATISADGLLVLTTAF